jgi:hypothetical protein
MNSLRLVLAQAIQIAFIAAPSVLASILLLLIFPIPYLYLLLVTSFVGTGLVLAKSLRR